MRVKLGTATVEHQEVFNRYAPLLEEYGLDISDFSTSWDIHKTNLNEIVSGKIAEAYARQADASLFDASGELKV